MMRHAILSRLEDGTLNYAQSLETLRDHLRIGQAYHATDLMGQTYRALALVERDQGHLRQAEAVLQRALHQLDKAPAATQGLLTLTLADLYRDQNRLKEALHHYIQADAQLAASAQHHWLVALTQQGWVQLALADTRAAQTCLSKAAAARTPTTPDTQRIAIRLGQAELALARGKTSAAWEAVTHAVALAIERDDRLCLASAFLTQSHIASQTGQSADDYVYATRWLLQTATLPATQARFWLHEAYYQRQHHNLGLTTRLAREALTIFQNLGNEQEARLAQRLCYAAV